MAARAEQGDPCSTCSLPFKVIESILNRHYPSPDSWACWGQPESARRFIWACFWICSRTAVCGLHGLAQSPFTLNLHRNLILALERQRFPEKTPVESDRWDWMHCAGLCRKEQDPL